MWSRRLSHHCQNLHPDHFQEVFPYHLCRVRRESRYQDLFLEELLVQSPHPLCLDQGQFQVSCLYQALLARWFHRQQDLYQA